MEIGKIKEILKRVKEGTLSVEEALETLKVLPYKDLGFARVDTHRSLRRGIPEVIYCPGKTPSQIVKIAQGILSSGNNLLATRAEPEVYRKIKKKWSQAHYHKEARAITVSQYKPPMKKGVVAVITAGTSDIGVAEEAAVTCEMMGSPVERLYDVGVAGLHRLLDKMGEIRRANVLIVAAGMEGALPSVVSSLVDKPVIALPTSSGYGASLGGVAALLAMLNSCSGGVAVVNIDNGFGAGYFAHIINR